MMSVADARFSERRLEQVRLVLPEPASSGLSRFYMGTIGDEQMASHAVDPHVLSGPWIRVLK